MSRCGVPLFIRHGQLLEDEGNRQKVVGKLLTDHMLSCPVWVGFVF